MKISACIITQNEEDWLKYTLDSLQGVVDEIIVVDGGSKDKTIELCNSFKNVKVFSKTFKGDYGAQREYAAKQATGDWILVIDSDEVLGDNAFLLKDYAENPNIDTYNMKMVHFIRDFGHEDATLAEHMCQNRFFRNTPEFRYVGDLHETPFSPTWKTGGEIKDVVLYHCGYLKGINTVRDKFEMNLKRSQIHTKDFLHQWKDWHLKGTFPTKVYTGPYPIVLKEAFYL